MSIDAAALFKIRKVYKLSQTELGDILGVSTGMIHFIETGKRALSKRVNVRIIEEFELTADKLAKIMQVYEQYRV